MKEAVNVGRKEANVGRKEAKQAGNQSVAGKLKEPNRTVASGKAESPLLFQEWTNCLLLS